MIFSEISYISDISNLLVNLNISCSLKYVNYMICTISTNYLK